MKTVSPSILMVVLGLTLAVGSMAAPTGAQAADDKGLFEQTTHLHPGPTKPF